MSVLGEKISFLPKKILNVMPDTETVQKSCFPKKIFFLKFSGGFDISKQYRGIAEIMNNKKEYRHRFFMEI